MNDLKNSSNGLLVLKSDQELSREQSDHLTDLITPLADALGVEPLVLGKGFGVELQHGTSALLERLCCAVERLVQQGEPPAAPEQVERPVLNARPTGLNSRPVVADGNAGMRRGE
jgi:hypothetical protein